MSSTSVEPPIELSLEPPVELSIEPPIELSLEPPVELTVEPPIELSIEPPVELSIEPPVELSVELSLEPPIELSLEPPIELSIKPPVKLSLEPPVELSIEPPVELSIEPPVELSLEPPVELSLEPPVELTVEPPIELSVEPPVGLSIEPPVELSVETPIELSVEPPKITSPFLKYIETPSLEELRTRLVDKDLNRKLPFVMVRDVVVHNKPDDCWVIIFGLVRDMTPLIEEYRNTPNENLLKPVLAFAGKDISHWFDEKTGDIKHFVHPITGVLVPYTPHGPIPHVSLQAPSSDWLPPPRLPWWKDPVYVVAKITARERHIRILNMLTGLEVQICVCAEDTINQIQDRYLAYNAHAQSYLWTYDRRTLDMDKHLDGNRIYDDKQTFEDLEMPGNYYVPCLMLYFKDDLTEA